MTSSVLAVQGLQKRFTNTLVVKGLDFSLTRGECFALLGPNGAGKTTTLRMCLGLATPTAGSINLLGFPIPAQAAQARARVGIVPQMDNLDPDFTVAENLLVFGRYFGLKAREIEQRIPNLLEFAGLQGKGKLPINSLSGGMKRRLVLARALLNDPELLVLDEPTTGLDPQARHLIWDRLRQLLSQGKTILLTTHFMDEAERLADRLAVIDQGQLIALGTPRELLAAHIEPEVIEIYGNHWDNWLETAKNLADRVEPSGETLFCYSHQPQPLLTALQGQSHLRYQHRQANLEDLFLKLTGRDLRD